jgi:hypothetical protein
MSWLGIDGVAAEIFWHVLVARPIPPLSHHGEFHMDQWPWWPGPMHIAYPILFVAAIAGVLFLALRKR